MVKHLNNTLLELAWLVNPMQSFVVQLHESILNPKTVNKHRVLCTFFKLANHLHSVFVKHMPHQAIKTTIIKNNVRGGKPFCSVSFFFQFFLFPCLSLCMYVYLFLSVCFFVYLSLCSKSQRVYDSFVIQFLPFFSMNINLNLTSRGGLVHLWVNFIIQ